MAGRKVGGFTLIEIAVSLTLVFVLSFIALRGISAARNVADVQQASQEFASFLAESGALAVNGERAAGCVPREAPACSIYAVRRASATEYERQAAGGGSVTVRALPTRTRFGTNWSPATFAYAPPLLSVSPAPHFVVIEHAADPATRRCVQVQALGTVDILGPGSPAGC